MHPETAEGWVLDIACLRKYPRDEYAERARAHTTACSQMGHCLESGYALVDADGRVTLLDPKATAPVLDALRRSDREAGVWLRVRREPDDGALATVEVTESPSPLSSASDA
ncbi:hypothetical protein [Rubrivirga marina]|jgi:hypothetical protein|uniref:Uncharacterized protein n=1 Tax=Rubrivirga marina TaxID=1196024 RepID=A0A271IV72_9BACT|nr:hypothetical protein [Rubrivirga marina]PAP74615.1 hypothetical protein BSZ37_20780 [Rubrivirga marina]